MPVPDGRAENRRRARVLLVFSVAVGACVLLFGGFAARVRALRRLEATGPNWSFPSRVYSDAVELTPGRTAPVAYLEAELDARDYRRDPAWSGAPGSYIETADGLAIALRGLPDERDPAGSGGPERVRVHVADGRIAAVERLGGVPGAQGPDLAHPPRIEPVLVSLLLDDERMWRTYVSLTRVPLAVQEAIIASEDRRFRTHAGVDVRGAARALVRNMRAHGVREGGSTITQQLARGLFLGRERTFTRKLEEVPLALGLELMLPKRTILEMYLNSVYWGQARGFAVGGIAQAARWYFDAPVESLGVLEGATLAAMIPAPNTFDPFKDPERVRERRNDVLHAMVGTHALDEAAALALAARPLDVRMGPAPVERFGSYAGYVRAALESALPRDVAGREGTAVFTTMDLAWQRQAEDAMAAGLDALDGGSRRPGRLQGAFVALDPTTSAVVALVGGRGLAAGDFNRAFQAKRQTGSAIKPIVYAAAFLDGRGLTPASTVADTQRTFGRGRWAWRPRNYDGRYHTEVTLAKALELSLNVATANVVDQVGPGAVADVGERFGLRGLKAVASIGLGSNEVSLVDLTNAYAVFASRGMRHPASPVRAVVDFAGRVRLDRPTDGGTAIPEGIAALMTGLLSNVVRYGVARPLVSAYGMTRPVAGKTGTTDDYKDAWFVGFTPDIVAGAWVGYDRPRSIGRAAAAIALPIWARAVGRMLDGFPPTPFLGDTQLEWANINPWNGCLVQPDSASTAAYEKQPFLLGTAPLTTCDTTWANTPYDEDYEYQYGEPDTLAPPDTVLEEQPTEEEPEDEPPADPE